jgi:transposase-like protein
VTAFALQINTGTVHTRAYVDVMTVVLSIADMLIRITREQLPMSEIPFACPDCGNDYYTCDYMEGVVKVHAELRCRRCGREFTVYADGEDFRRY